MAASPIQRAAQEARAKGRRLPKPAPYKVPGTAARVAERRFGKAARALVLGWLATLEPMFPEEPARVDAPASARAFEQSIPTGRAWERRALGDVQFVMADAEREQRNAEARSMRTLGIDVVGGEPWLRDVLDERGAEASDLITKMATDTRRRVAKLAAQGMEEGRPRTWLREQVEAVAGITERRAQLIARDQVRKLQGALHEARQTDLGIDSYLWRNSRDEKVAGNPNGLYPDVPSNSPTHGNHWEREGRRFLWKKQGGRLVEVLANGKTRITDYRDGHPGDPIQDRCFAEPYIPGLEDLLGYQEQAPVAEGYKTPSRPGRQTAAKAATAQRERPRPRVTQRPRPAAKASKPLQPAPTLHPPVPADFMQHAIAKARETGKPVYVNFGKVVQVPGGSRPTAQYSQPARGNYLEVLPDGSQRFVPARKGGR